MYLVSAQLAQINNNPESPFGGPDMILQGISHNFHLQLDKKMHPSTVGL